MMMHKELGFH